MSTATTPTMPRAHTMCYSFRYVDACDCGRYPMRVPETTPSAVGRDAGAGAPSNCAAMREVRAQVTRGDLVTPDHAAISLYHLLGGDGSDMGKVFEGIDERNADFVNRQHVFFVATA